MLLIKGSLANSIDQNESCGTLPRRRVRTNQNIVLRVAAVEFPRSFEQLEEFADDRMFRLVRYNANHPRRRASEAQMNRRLNMSGTGSAILRKLPNNCGCGSNVIRGGRLSGQGGWTFPGSICAQDKPAVLVLRFVRLRPDRRRRIQFFA